MSKTAGCAFALGVCMVLAAACGDDDGGPATGGNGGSAGSGGRAGSGNAGRAGAGGAPMGGSGGTPSGGASGAPAGAAGESGNGGSAGADEQPDGGGPDGGPQGTCPAFAASALLIAPQTEQQLVIARVLFLGDGTADVVIRNTSEPVPGDAGATSFFIGEPVELCSGPENCAIMEDICDEAGFDLQLLAGEEAVCNIDAIAAEGELGIMSADVVNPDAFSSAYIAWDVSGGFVSQPPTPGDAGVATSLEDRAANRDGPDFWTLGERIPVTAGEDTLVGTGETDVAAGFVSCDR